MKNKTNPRIILISVSVACLLCVALILSIVNSGYSKLHIANIETKEVIALGENRESIESKVGYPCSSAPFLNSKSYSYDDENLSVVYDGNNRAVYIRCLSEKYSTVKDLCIGDNLKDKLGNDAARLNHKTLYFSGDALKCKMISLDEKDKIIATSGYENLYVADFGASKANGDVEYITLGEYETIVFGTVR